MAGVIYKSILFNKQNRNSDLRLPCLVNAIVIEILRRNMCFLSIASLDIILSPMKQIISPKEVLAMFASQSEPEERLRQNKTDGD